ncbi:hypothetical protein P152DRAFT_15779 [Eremomyces bilateralis CBS 781.70]|uniref:Uncharacterized protein n=1 Tax=Eremomyces bilateralis CBS 781.70 TaxID=1392243 RepID=A0A6G1GHD2_9PEZI|nr:uncharacterized protein P152DRAFT_15779 [Eremomyces bilateralis CBS 781.70]KAF1817346.1 hypothetical protein P152DRAFT_15779 [Eremomyces bilateralis CBS 781.70]
MWEAIHKIQEAQDSIVKAFESTSTVVKALKDSNERTLRSVASHSTRIQAMENGMERTPSSPAMAVNEQKARALLEGPSKAQTSMTLFGSPKKANNDRLSLLSTDTVNRMMKEMAERVAALERENGQMMNDMRKLKEEFTHDLRLLRKDGDWVCNKVKDLADRLYTVEGDCTQLWRKTQGLELRGDTSGNYPACYGSEHGLFKNKIHNLEARCDSLKKKLGDFEGRLNWLHVPSKPIIAVGEHESDPAIRQALKDITTPREDLADIGTARLPMSVTGSEVSSIRSALAETRTKAIQDQVSNKAAICNLVQSVGLLWEVMMSIDTSHTLQGKKHRLDVSALP